MKKQLKRYYKDIKHNLPCYNKTMRKMVDDLKMSVDIFIEENNITDFKIIENHFGTAEDISREFAMGLDNSYIKSYKFKKFAIITVVSILAAILIVVSFISTYIYIKTEINKPVFYDNQITYKKDE